MNMHKDPMQLVRKDFARILPVIKPYFDLNTNDMMQLTDTIALMTKDPSEIVIEAAEIAETEIL